MKHYLWLLLFSISTAAWAADPVALNLPAQPTGVSYQATGDSQGSRFTYTFWREQVNQVWMNLMRIEPISSSTPFICGLNFNVAQGEVSTTNLYLADTLDNRHCDTLDVATTFVFKEFNIEEVDLQAAFFLQYRTETPVSIDSLAQEIASGQAGKGVTIDTGSTGGTDPGTGNGGTGTTGFTQADLDAATQAARSACLAAPASCGISITTTSQAQLDAATLAGRTACITDPASCGITTLFTQAQLDAAAQAARTACLNDPLSCGITTGFSQTQLDAAAQTARTACTNDPASCGISVGFSQTQLDVAAQTARTACTNDPASCGISVGFTQTQLDAAVQTSRTACSNNPASCGIDVGFTQAQLDAAAQTARAACTNDPASCAIDIGFNQAQLDAATQSGRAACLINPSSCGIEIGFTQAQVNLAQQQARDACALAPDACGIQTFTRVEIQAAEQSCIEQYLPTLDHNFSLHIPYLQFKFISNPVGNEQWPTYWLRLDYRSECSAPAAFSMQDFGVYTPNAPQ